METFINYEMDSECQILNSTFLRVEYCILQDVLTNLFDGKLESQGSGLGLVPVRTGYLLKQTSTIRYISYSEVTHNPPIS